LIEAQSSGVENVGNFAEGLIGKNGRENEIAAARSRDFGR